MYNTNSDFGCTVASSKICAHFIKDFHISTNWIHRFSFKLHWSWLNHLPDFGQIESTDFSNSLLHVFNFLETTGLPQFSELSKNRTYAFLSRWSKLGRPVGGERGTLVLARFRGDPCTARAMRTLRATFRLDSPVKNPHTNPFQTPSK